MESRSVRNLAFIDAQNLARNTRDYGWSVDLKRFRVYLAEKYKVEKAYYFIGTIDKYNKEVYQYLYDAGYVVVFRAHNHDFKSRKKGNVDTDIVFSVMRKIAEGEPFDNVILVSGDGDYFKMMNYLIKKGRFGKLLSPHMESTSSLYKPFIPKYVAFLDADGTREKIKKDRNRSPDEYDDLVGI